MEESRSTMKAFIETATELNEDTRRNVERVLLQMFGKKVSLHVSIHPELLGGMIVRAGDLVLDNSLRSQLGNLRQKLTGAAGTAGA